MLSNDGAVDLSISAEDVSFKIKNVFTLIQTMSTMHST